MLLLTHQITENTIGGGPIGWVSDYIAFENADFGSAISEIEIKVRSNPEMPGKWRKRMFFPGILSSQIPQPESHQHATFRRKAKKLIIHWMTQHLTEYEMEKHNYPNATQDLFWRAAADVYDALDWGLHARLKPADDFDISACLAWVQSTQTESDQTNTEFRHNLAIRSKKSKRLITNIHMQAKIKTDWAVLHPDAAALLSHPNLWNETDPRMPQGNPFGQGISNHFDYYASLSLSETLKSFHATSYEDADQDSDRVRALQIELGLVFAHIKKRGTVAPDMVNALKKRMGVEAKRANSFWVHRSKYGRSSHFAWMQNYLDGF